MSKSRTVPSLTVDPLRPLKLSKAIRLPGHFPLLDYIDCSQWHTTYIMNFEVANASFVVKCEEKGFKKWPDLQRKDCKYALKALKLN